MSKFKLGVISGKDLGEVFEDAKKNKYALPAVNVSNTSTVNSVLETAANLNSPVIVQFSNGGCQFFAGKGLSNDDFQSSIAGGISGAIHTHQMAELYGVTVILHTDHCAKKLLPWIDGLLEFTNEMISDEKLIQYNQENKTEITKEALYYLEIFEELFPGRKDIVPRWIPRKDWGCSQDPSGRAQNVHVNHDLNL